MKKLSIMIAMLFALTGCTSTADTTATPAASSTPTVEEPITPAPTLEAEEGLEHYVEQEEPVKAEASGDTMMEATQGKGVLDLGEGSPVVLGGFDKVATDSLTNLHELDTKAMWDAYTFEDFYRDMYELADVDDIAPIRDVTRLYMMYPIITTMMIDAFSGNSLVVDEDVALAHTAIIEALGVDAEITEEVLQEIMAVDNYDANFLAVKNSMVYEDIFNLGEAQTFTIFKEDEEEDWDVDISLLSVASGDTIAEVILATIYCTCGGTYEVIAACNDESIGLEEVASILLQNFTN